MQRVFLKISAIALLMSSAAYGQSLGDVARANREKQNAENTSAAQPRVITNANLPKDPDANQEPAEAQSGTNASSTAADHRSAQQRWAEQRRQILLIVPASLRKQWTQELQSKFSVASEILESKSYRERKKAGVRKPFEVDNKVVVTSYEFAARQADEGAEAHLWQLLIVGQIPFVAFFAFTRLARDPGSALRVLGVQAAAAIAALAPVYLLRW